MREGEVISKISYNAGTNNIAGSSGIVHFTKDFAFAVQILSAISIVRIQLGAQLTEVVGIGSTY